METKSRNITWIPLTPELVDQIEDLQRFPMPGILADAWERIFGDT